MTKIHSGAQGDCRECGKGKCGGCETTFTTSTASNEHLFCSQLCESGGYKKALKRL